MNLSSLSRQTRKSLLAFVRAWMRRANPEIDRLERKLAAARRSHRSTQSVLTQLRDVRLAQLRSEIHG